MLVPFPSSRRSAAWLLVGLAASGTPTLAQVDARSVHRAMVGASQRCLVADQCQDETPFHRLQHLFESGVRPRPEDMVGWRVGRAVEEAQPWKILPLLIATRVAPNTSGPAFPEPDVFATPFDPEDSPADRFDVLSDADLRRVPRLQAGSYHGGEPYEGGPGVFQRRSVVFSWEAVGGTQVAIRKAGDFLVVRYLQDPGGHLREHAYGYLFRDVTPPAVRVRLCEQLREAGAEGPAFCRGAGSFP